MEAKNSPTWRKAAKFQLLSAVWAVAGAATEAVYFEKEA